MSRFPFLGAAFVASALIATAPAEALFPIRGLLRAPAPLRPAAESMRVEKILYTFPGGSGGIAPVGGLVRDAAGALYGITQSGGKYGKGVVFMVTPPPAGKTAWTEKDIYDFDAPNGISGPSYSGLTRDSSGSLYGVTYKGGAGQRSGVAFRLSPPPAGQTTWTATTLHAFGAKGDGAYPFGNPSIGDGALLGTTQYGGAVGAGTVFALTPPTGQGPWTETVAHSFTGLDGESPSGGVIANASGEVFGTAFYGGSGSSSGCINFSCGTVYELTPPAGSGPWSFTLLHSFAGPDGANPTAPLLSRPSGTLFGTTEAGGVMGPNCNYNSAGCGVVFELTPPPAGKTNWTESVVYAFAGGTDGDNPDASGVIADSHGVLYGTTLVGGSSCNNGVGCGVAYELVPPAPGKTQWTESAIHIFGSGSDGQMPDGGLVMAPDGALYGETSAGGAKNDGIIYELK